MNEVDEVDVVDERDEMEKMDEVDVRDEMFEPLLGVRREKFLTCDIPFVGLNNYRTSSYIQRSDILRIVVQNEPLPTR